MRARGCHRGTDRGWGNDGSCGFALLDLILSIRVVTQLCNALSLFLSLLLGFVEVDDVSCYLLGSQLWGFLCAEYVGFSGSGSAGLS